MRPVRYFSREMENQYFCPTKIKVLIFQTQFFSCFNFLKEPNQLILDIQDFDEILSVANLASKF